ncbi:hypothetical protein LX87_02507 [Larkinella arboricola]|uniref:PilJ/NarX-like methyl-accepting chemotaxis transducer n=1 Tax=Larkinella arboricola TaxID=643671 RepID=A0A327WZK9_LARAB|nr:hypothetical protein [Larkinella arboricola]RAJ97604.1 hypothetical protein LX87_02507 [Larkinella arboricola]
MKSILLPLILLAFISNGCVSFESVKTVGKVGTALTDYKAVNEDVTFLCNEIKSIQGFERLPCDSLADRSKRINQGVDILVGYSNALLLATQDNDFTLSDVVEQTVRAGHAAQWISATDNQLAGAKEVSDGIHQLITGGIKRRAIGQAVKTQGPHVDRVCAGLIELIALQKQLFQTYLNSVQLRANENAGFQLQLARKNNIDPTPLNLDKDVITLVKLYVNAETKKLDQIETTVKAFRAGHQELVKQSGKVGRKKDGDVVKQIIQSLKGIYNGIEQFSTPDPAN